MKIPFVKSLRFQMPMIIVALGVIPPILIGIGYASNRAARIIREDAKNMLELEAQKLRGNVSQWLEMNESALRNLAAQPAIESLEVQQQKPVLETIPEYYQSIYLAHTTNTDGINIARSDDQTPKNYGDRQYFKGAMAGQEISYQPLIGKTSKKPALCIAAPIVQKNIIQGATTICSSLDTITEQVQETDLGETGVEIVVDSTGKAVAHTNPELTSGDTLTNLSNYTPVANVLAGNEGSFVFVDEAGTEWIAHGKLLSNGWAAITLQHTSEAFAAERQYQQTAIASILLVIVATAALTSVIVNRMVTPLTELTDVSLQIADGEFDRRVQSNRDDEIGVLADSFNNMTQKLQGLIGNIEAKAAQQQQQRQQLEMAIYTLLSEVSDATEGDLTVRANLDSMELSTVADLFNAIISNLQEIAIETKQSTRQVGSSLKQNEAEIRLLTKQAIAEAEETRNTLISVELMSESIQTVAANAGEVEKIADDTYNIAVDSTKNMNSTVDSIIELKNTVSDTKNKMELLGESSQRIARAVGSIEEIALKTNVLAVNARVEARRAGEYGQGFTIVAEQVGALAEQSAQATKEIATIVAAIQAETGEVSQAMNSGTIQALESTRLVEVSKQNLETVLARAKEINQLISSISQATISQATTSQEVTDLMQKIAQLSETTSRSSGKVAQSIVETAQVAQKLESTVGQFKVAEST